jgi:hypothetical protein
LLLSSYNNYNTQLVITGDATIKDDGTGQWFSGASGTGSNSAPAGSVLDNDSVSLTVTSPTVSESAGFAQWAVQYGTGKKVFLELADLTATAAADLLPFSNGNFLQYNNGSGWTDYSTGSQVAVGAGNSLLVRAGIRGSDGPEASEQLNLRVRPAVGNQYDISGTNVVDVDIATNAARADAAQTLITNGNFSAGTILERWGLIPGWTSSGGGTSTYAKVVNFNRDSATNNSMEGLYFGNSVVVNGIMPILDANGVTTAGTPFQPATTMGRGAGCGR